MFVHRLEQAGLHQLRAVRQQGVQLKGDFEGGLKIGYSGNYGAYEVALFARNITNEKNLKGVIENYMAAVYNEPRTVGVSLNMNW
jgi:iron complex outermembrane receptor protein